MTLEELNMVLGVLVEVVSRTYEPCVRRYVKALWHALIARHGGGFFEGFFTCALQVANLCKTD